ncbi:hypothetical protein RYX36_025521 [Vicia faba]
MLSGNVAISLFLVFIVCLDLASGIYNRNRYYPLFLAGNYSLFRSASGFILELDMGSVFSKASCFYYFRTEGYVDIICISLQCSTCYLSTFSLEVIFSLN